MGDTREDPTVHTSVRVPRSLLRDLDALRRPYRTTWTRTEHVREAIREYVERHREVSHADG